MAGMAAALSALPAAGASPLLAGSFAHRIPAGRHFDMLAAVAGSRPSDVWAVGIGNAANTTLIEHWNGTRWRVVPNPDAPTLSQLTGVAATSPANAWAVGFYETGSDGNTEDHALIEQWNGRRWRRVPCPSPNGPIFNSVTATSRSDAWAVGSNAHGALVEHWNGRTWSVAEVGTPNLAGYQLNGVAAASRTNAWAVGYSQVGPRTLVAHWNGRNWSWVPSPSPGGESYGGADALNSVVAISRSDAWAAGYYETGTQRVQKRVLIAHWNGHEWSKVPSPLPVGLGHWNALGGIATSSRDNLWAVGAHAISSRFQGRTLALRWSGVNWVVASTPSPSRGPSASALAGVWAGSRRNVWAVGYVLSGRGYLTLIEHWDGTRWRVVPSPSP